jgi:hypothetical protein
MFDACEPLRARHLRFDDFLFGTAITPTPFLIPNGLMLPTVHPVEACNRSSPRSGSRHTAHTTPCTFPGKLDTRESRGAYSHGCLRSSLQIQAADPAPGHNDRADPARSPGTYNCTGGSAAPAPPRAYHRPAARGPRPGNAARSAPRSRTAPDPPGRPSNASTGTAPDTSSPSCPISASAIIMRPLQTAPAMPPPPPVARTPPHSHRSWQPP